MGQAKNKAMRFAASIIKLQDIDISQVASAMRKLAVATSAKYGHDCYVHAGLCQGLLKEIGVETELCIGFASWRVGDGDGDVITHAPLVGNDPEAFNYANHHVIGAVPYHAWLECGHWIIDFTTYQLTDKANKLDAMDGGHTSVDWHPDFLMVEKTKISTFKEVAKNKAGLFWYKRDFGLERFMKSQAGPIEEDDLESLRLLYNNPDIAVMGPFGGSWEPSF